MSAPLRFPAAEVFIETGHGAGDTFAEVLAPPYSYKVLHTVECDPVVVQRATDRFAADARVHVHQGTSPEVLPHICDPDRSTVFWLDAHYSGGLYGTQDMEPKFGECPVLAELAAIRAVPWRTMPPIFIDDAPLFLGGPYTREYAASNPAAYPSLDALLAALPEGYKVTVHRQWRPIRAFSNLAYIGRRRYLRCLPPRPVQ